MAPSQPITPSRFPSLRGDQVFFDNAGGTQVLDSVITSVSDYLSNNNVQLGASYKISKTSTAAYNAAHDAAARFINSSPDEVVFGPSTTQLLRNLSHALKFEKGDEIVVSMMDHEANIAPWVDLAEREGLTLVFWKPFGDMTDPELYPASVMHHVTYKTKLVALCHASNIAGTVHNIKAIASSAREHGALVCVDGVAYAPHRSIDVKELGVDFYVFSWYKVFGPHVATLYAKWSAQMHLRSLGHFFNPTASLTDKLGLAGASYELCQAVVPIVDYLSEGSRWDEIRQHEEANTQFLLTYLEARDDVTIYGKKALDIERRVPVVSFTVKGWSSKEIVETVEARSPFGFRWGSFYSNRLIRDCLGLGPDGVVRVSLAHYNTLEEVQNFTVVLDEVLEERNHSELVVK